MRKSVRPHDGGSAPYSAAIIAKGTLVFTAGQIGRDSRGQLAEGIEAQTRVALSNLKGVLSEAGSDLDHVVRILVFLTDLADGPGFNRVYTQFFPTEPPARTRVQAAALAPGCLLELEAIAVLAADEQ